MKCFIVFIILCALNIDQIVRSEAPPNIVFVLTDDQDLLLNGLIPMKQTLKHVANKGVTFQNAFANSPICCPSRSSILTGKFLHNTQVRNNSISGNCSSLQWQKVHEHKTIAAILKRNNYSTFYAGKYLNQYGSAKVGGVNHVPQGYDWWMGLKGNSKYYNYTLSINGSEAQFTKEYLTDVIGKHALDFLDLHKQPFFMILAPPAAHAPFTPAPRHVNTFPSVKALRTPSFNFTPINKHWLMQLPPLHLPSNVTILDNIERRRLQTLLSVDEMIEKLMHKLKMQSVLDNTYVIFSSDNGFHIGQFGQPWDKRQPYETDIRVPLLIRGPKIKQKALINLPVSLVDLAPTILDFAGVQIPEDMDGISFKTQIEEEANHLINHKIGERLILIEYFGEGNAKSVDALCPWAGDNNLAECSLENWCKCEDSRNNSYTCLRHISSSIDFKFCQFHDEKNFQEAYDLKTDPYELKNIAVDFGGNKFGHYKNLLVQLKNCKGFKCRNQSFNYIHT